MAAVSAMRFAAHAAFLLGLAADAISDKYAFGSR